METIKLRFKTFSGSERLFRTFLFSNNINNCVKNYTIITKNGCHYINITLFTKNYQNEKNSKYSKNNLEYFEIKRNIMDEFIDYAVAKCDDTNIDNSNINEYVRFCDYDYN